MAILDAVFANKAGQTPQDVERRRKMAQALVEAGSGGKPPSSGLELAGRLAMTLTGQYQAGKADRQDATNRADANSLIAKTLLGGDPYAPASSGAGSPVPMTGAANEMSGGGGPQSYRDAIAGIESAGSGDYSAVGPTDPKLGRALGRYQVMEANIGPWSQEALGRAVTPDEFLADPKLQDAIFDKKFGSYVQQYGPQGAAQAWFAGPGGVGKLDRKDSLGTTVSAYGDKFSRALGGSQQVASLDPAAGLSQAPSPQQAASAVPAPMQGPTPAAPSLPPPTTVASAPPVASVPQQQPASLMSSAVPGQAPSAPQMMAQTSPSKRAQIAALLQNPYTQELGQQMLMQEYGQQQEEQKWRAREDYKLNSQRADPSYKLEQDYKQAQLDALRAKTGKRANVTNLGDGWLYDNDEGKAFRPQDEAAKPGGSGFRFGGNSVEAQSLNGLIESGQITEGQAQQLGAGKTITDPSTGSMMFLTPQGIFKQQQGQQAAPMDQSQSPINLFGDSGNAPAQNPAAAPMPAAPGSVQNAPVPQANDSVSSGNPGIIPLTGGKPQKLLSEAERKNQSLFTVIKPELKVVEDNFDALTDPSNQVYSKMPFSEWKTTPAYQQAANSLQTIISSYLYSVSGATATPEEVRKQTEMLTPRPLESKESIANKKQRIRTMVNAVAQAGSLPPMEAPAATGNDADIQAARDAIAKGAPRDKVIQRLRDANIDPSGL